MPVPKPPYPLDSMHTLAPPLGSKRAAIIAWLVKASPGTSSAQLNTMSDATLLQTYASAYLGWVMSTSPTQNGIPVAPPGILDRIGQLGIDTTEGAVSAADQLSSIYDGIRKLLAFLANPVRLGELVVGVVLLGVGVKAVVGGNAGRTVSVPSRTIVRTVTAPQRYAAETNRQAARAYATAHARAAGRVAGRG